MKNIVLVLLVLFLSIPAFAQKKNKREKTVTEDDTTYVMKKYFFCILKMGANRFQSKKEIKKIQKGHQAHINKLVDEGKIILAGDFDDNTKQYKSGT